MHSSAMAALNVSASAMAREATLSSSWRRRFQRDVTPTSAISPPCIVLFQWTHVSMVESAVRAVVAVS